MTQLNPAVQKAIQKVDFGISWLVACVYGLKKDSLDSTQCVLQNEGRSAVEGKSLGTFTLLLHLAAEVE